MRGALQEESGQRWLLEIRVAGAKIVVRLAGHRLQAHRGEIEKDQHRDFEGGSHGQDARVTGRRPLFEPAA